MARSSCSARAEQYDRMLRIQKALTSKTFSSSATSSRASMLLDLRGLHPSRSDDPCRPDGARHTSTSEKWYRQDCCLHHTHTREGRAQKPKTQALILVPTRELALQTSQVCKTLGQHLGVNVMVTTGGVGLKDDILRLNETVHIIVGTPGRIADLARKEVVKLDECTTFVMDEADKLLSPEFTPTIEQLLSFHPKERQVMLFSATFPVTVKHFQVCNSFQFP